MRGGSNRWWVLIEDSILPDPPCASLVCLSPLCHLSPFSRLAEGLLCPLFYVRVVFIFFFCSLPFSLIFPPFSASRVFAFPASYSAGRLFLVLSRPGLLPVFLLCVLPPWFSHFCVWLPSFCSALLAASSFFSWFLCTFFHIVSLPSGDLLFPRKGSPFGSAREKICEEERLSRFWLFIC